MKPSRELDALVAEKVMGLSLCGCTDQQKEASRGAYLALYDKDPFAPTKPSVGHTASNGTCNWCGRMTPLKYSTSLEAAWTVLEKVGDYRIEATPHWLWVDFGGDACEGAETLPLAICLAALKSVGVEG